MAKWVTIRPSGHRFAVEGRDTIIRAGLKSGLALAYGCSNGTCGDCRARLVAGEVTALRHHDYVFTAAEKARGLILMCVTGPASDELVVEAPEAAGAEDIPTQWIDIGVTRTDYPTADVVILRARTPRSQRFRFLAGQSVTLTIEGVGVRQVPVASCPCDDRNLEFHIAHAPGDAFCDALFNRDAAVDRLGLMGPQGTFVLSEASGRRLIFIAGDTGFAPVRSLIEHALSVDEDARISLYWSVGRAGGHYMANLCRSWSDALDEFRFHASVGEEPAATVARVASDHPDLADCDVYVAGPEALPDAARALLPGHGLPHDRLFTESVF